MYRGAGGSTSQLTQDLCKKIREKGYRVNMHLTCTNMDASMIDEALKSCIDSNIHNIVALRGDPPAGTITWNKTESGFSCASDLVKHVRSDYATDDFCISVAGYPEGHPNAISKFSSLSNMTDSEMSRYSKQVNDDGDIEYLVCKDDDFKNELLFLKSKVSSGANIIITQMFFDSNVYIEFVKACRVVGITVPIIPGIMSISTYAGFQRMVKFCKTRVPEIVLNQMDQLKDDEAGFKAYAIDFGIRMCRDLLDFHVPGLHFYTLNTSVTTSAIIDGLEMAL